VIRQLFSSRIAECDTLKANARYEEALDCYTAIHKSTDSLSRVMLYADLGSRIGECRFHLAYHDGLIRLGTRDFIEAGRLFVECKNLQHQWKLEADSTLDSLFRQTYAFYLVGLLRQGEARIWRDDFSGAANFADSIVHEIDLRPVTGDSIVRNAISIFRKKMANRICWNRKETAEIFCIRAWRNLELLKYTRASQLLDSAVALLKDHPECGFDIRPAKDTLKKYEFPSAWQLMQTKIESLLLGQNYDAVIPMYIEAEKFYVEKRISSFGLESIKLYDFVRSKENRLLTVNTVGYFSGRNEFREAFRYLDLLRLQGMPVKEAKNEIFTVSRALAEEDFSKDPDKDPAIMVKEYTSGFKWFTKFEFYYIYRWNEMRKEKVME
jgi:hypothetical protein